MRIDTPMNEWPLVDANIQMLVQGLELIARLDDESYAEECVVPGASHPRVVLKVGSHFRHCLDFYMCFLRGLAAGAIDYDSRERNEGVEKSRTAAMSRIKFIVAVLSRLTTVDCLREVQVRMESMDLRVEHRNWSVSSLRRELQFLLSHTVHHYAFIALALRLQGVEPGTEFGVAPSTLAYWRKTV